MSDQIKEKENNMRYQYLLFDLDGTITDPKEGITKSAQYALEAFSIHEPDAGKLTPFIGPPLTDSFLEFYHMPPEQAALAVKKYRERFETVGWLENLLYDGMDSLLRDLRDAGCRLAVASSKPTVFVERILAHFDIAQYFAVVVGSELDGTRAKKEEVVQEALRQLFGESRPAPHAAAMIGDRRFDIEGAKAHQLDSIGVTYGYALPGELAQAGADFIVESVEELRGLLMQ